MQEAIEIIVACSAMAVLKQEEAKEEDQAPKSKWTKWKRGGIIGAAALTGGTLMAITGGIIIMLLQVIYYIHTSNVICLISWSFFNIFLATGLAAPAIAAGFSALAPTLGTIIPVIGAGGFAAVATAAGSVAGSVAVAASFGGE